MPFTRVTLPVDIEDADYTAAEDALRAVPGVRRVYLSSAVEMAYIEYDPSCCDRADLEAALNHARSNSSETT